MRLNQDLMLKTLLISFWKVNFNFEHCAILDTQDLKFDCKWKFDKKYSDLRKVR